LNFEFISSSSILISFFSTMSTQLKPRLFRRHFWRTRSFGLIGLSLVLPLALTHIPATAQQITQAKIVEILDGDQVYIQDRKARRNDTGNLGQQIRTARARAGLRFNVGAGIRLGQNSWLVVGGGCIRLNRGKVMIAGATGGNRGCVGSIVATSRGTVYVMEIDDNGKGQVTVLEGSVELSNPDNPGVKSVVVSPGQAATITPAGEVGATTQLSQAQLQTVAAPMFEGFQESLPDLEKIVVIRQPTGFTSSFLRDALTGTDDFSRDYDPLKGKPSVDFTGISNIGTFVRTGTNTGIFVPSSGAATVPISLDFNQKTISIGGVSGVTNSFGLSGQNVSGTVILSNGQAVRLQVFGVGLQEPAVGQPFTGSLSVGTVRDR
jgi:hypothetical protein